MVEEVGRRIRVDIEEVGRFMGWGWGCRGRVSRWFRQPLV